MSILRRAVGAVFRRLDNRDEMVGFAQEAPLKRPAAEPVALPGTPKVTAPAGPRHFELRSELPAHTKVLTAAGERYADPEQGRLVAALVLDTGITPPTALLLTAAEAEDSETNVALLEVRARLVIDGFKVPDAPSRAAAALIRELNAPAKVAAPIVPFSNQEENTGHRRLWMDLLAMAVKVNASDVHIEIRTDEPSRVRFRVGGQLVEAVQFMSRLTNPAKQLQAMVGYCYQYMTSDGTGSDSDYKREGDQSAQLEDISIRDPNTQSTRRIGGRLQTMRSVGSRATSGPLDGVTPSDLDLRLFYSDNRDIPSLASLGYLPSQVELLSGAVARRGGMLVISGRVGNGKSTSLRSLYAMLPDHWKKYAIEDPSELWHPNTTRIAVQRSGANQGAAEAAFREKLLNIKRGDLDSLLVGEIRDSVSLGVVRDIVFSGHPVFTTLHADSAFGQIPRMLTPEMGLSVYDVSNAAFLNAMVHQALVPTLCAQCALSGREAQNLLGADYLNRIESRFSVDPTGLRVRNEQGCQSCRRSGLPALFGYAGREVVAECFRPDDEDRELLQDRKDREVARRYRLRRRAGFDGEDTFGKLAIEVGLYKALQGRIDPRSVEATFWPFEQHSVLPRLATDVRVLTEKAQ